MFNKHKFWAGYDTSKGKFYLANKDFSEKVWEDNLHFNEQYALWLTGKSKWSIFGLDML